MNEIPYYAFAEINHELYFSALRFNGLFKINLCSHDITYIGRVKKEKVERDLHRFAYVHKDCIYFFPGNGEHIVKLQLSTQEISSIELPQTGCYGNEYKFSAIVSVENAVWMIPGNYNALLKFDLDNEQIEKFDNWPSKMNIKYKNLIWFVAGCCVEHYLCMCPYESDYFVVFDMESRKMHLWEWDYQRHAFSAMLLHKDVLWFIPERDYPYIVGYSLKTREKYYIETGEYVEENVRSLHDEATAVGDYVVLTPFETNDWVVLDTRTHKIEKRKVSKGGWSEKFIYPMYDCIKQISDGLIVTSLYHEYALFVNLNNGEVKEVRAFMNDRINIQVLKDALSQGGFYSKRQTKGDILNERVWGLSNYLHALCLCSDENDLCTEKNSYGAIIYEQIVKML